MPRKTAKVLKITFSDSPLKKQFRKYETLLEWLRTEQERWQWLVSEANQFNGAGNSINHAYQKIRQEIDNSQAQQKPIGEAEEIATQYLQLGSSLLFSDGTTARAIDAIRERFGDTAAGFVFALQQGSVRISDARNVDEFAAAIIFVLPELEQPGQLGHKLKQERANYRGAISTIIEKFEGSEQALWDEHNQEIMRTRRLFIKQLKRVRSATTAIIEQTSKSREAAIQSIRNVENTYREAMGLQAPVEYWEKKAKTHRDQEALAASRLRLFFPLAAFVFAASFAGAATLLWWYGTQLPATIYVIVGAGLGSVATLIFWVGRLLTRLYLSQNHLRHDAEERAVMTTTYLALSHEEAATPDDKKIILAALFRSAADGLVKDDAAPDLSFAGLLSRVVSK